MPVVEFRQPTGGIPVLDSSTVQLWRIRLDAPEEIHARLVTLLSQDERERAGRFYFPHLRTRFTAGRAALRVLLGAQLGSDPSALQFAYTQHDKPYLPGSRLRFNVSHADGLALIAIAIRREVGVDLEHVRPRIDEDQIAHRFFSAAEVADYLAVPEAQRQQAFYNCWTRKEAYIKAIGEGLSFPLDQFRVSLAPDAPPRLIEVIPSPAEADRWKLLHIEPGRGFTGALIAEGQDWSLEAYDFSFPNSYNHPEADALPR